MCMGTWNLVNSSAFNSSLLNINRTTCNGKRANDPRFNTSLPCSSTNSNTLNNMLHEPLNIHKLYIVTSTGEFGYVKIILFSNTFCTRLLVHLYCMYRSADDKSAQTVSTFIQHWTNPVHAFRRSSRP